MIHGMKKAILSTFVVTVLTLGYVSVASPALAATTSTVATASSEMALVTGAAPLAVPTHATAILAPRAGIDWNNVVRVLGSMVECEALIPIYELIYFPAFIFCAPYGNTAVMVIVH